MSTTASKAITEDGTSHNPEPAGPCQGRLERCDLKGLEEITGFFVGKKFLNLRRPMESYAAEA